jgi:hypothetical protein
MDAPFFQNGVAGVPRSLISKRVKIHPVLIEDGMAVSIDETEQADLTVFAEVWLKDIRVQQRL